MSSSTDDELVTSQVSKTPRVAQKSTHGTRGSRPDQLASQSKTRRGQPSTSRGTKDDPMDVEHGEEAEPQAPLRSRKKPESSGTHGTRSAKGKARGGNRTTHQLTEEPVIPNDPIDIDEEENFGNEVDEAAADTMHSVAHAINVASGSQRTIKSKPTNDTTSSAKLRNELTEARAESKSLKARNTALAKENGVLKTQCDKLKAQLDELFTIRQTEAEKLLEEQTQVFEARIETQQRTIQELTSNLARVEPLSRSGSGSVLHLLTRDAADEEKRGLEEELKRVKDSLAEKDKIIATHTQTRDEKSQEEKELRYELKLLQEALAKSKVAKSTRLTDDPKHAATLKFYEDVSDVVVFGVDHIGRSKYMNLDEWLLNCLYTHSDGAKLKAEGYALNFTLRTQWDPRPGVNPPYTSEDQFKQTLHYNPLSLDNEKPHFVERLDFLKAPFTFERSQLPVFLRTLRDTISDAVSPPEEDADESRTAIEITD